MYFCTPRGGSVWREDEESRRRDLASEGHETRNGRGAAGLIWKSGKQESEGGVEVTPNRRHELSR